VISRSQAIGVSPKAIKKKLEIEHESSRTRPHEESIERQLVDDVSMMYSFLVVLIYVSVHSYDRLIDGRSFDVCMCVRVCVCVMSRSHVIGVSPLNHSSNQNREAKEKNKRNCSNHGHNRQQTKQASIQQRSGSGLGQEFKLP
jgi:hypothetical protein